MQLAYMVCTVVSFDDIVRRISLEGEITSDDVIKAEIIKQALYKQSNLLSVGTKILPPKPWAQLDAKWTFPTEVDGEFPVPEGAVAMRSRPVQQVEWGAVMQMAEFRFAITDWAKARQQANLTVQQMIKRGAEWFQECEDSQILDAIYARVGNTVSVSPGNEWDAAGVSTDPEKDIMDAWAEILDHSNIGLEDMKNVALVYPAKVDNVLRGLKLIGNIQTSLMSYLKGSYGFTFLPTRYYDEAGSTKLQDDALLVVSGDATGIHGVYSGGAIPLSETWRENGRGQEFLTKKLFFTAMQPESTSVTNSYRVVKIANVI